MFSDVIEFKEQYDQIKLYKELGQILEIINRGIHSWEEYNRSVYLHRKLLREYPEIMILKYGVNNGASMHFDPGVQEETIYQIVEALRTDGMAMVVAHMINEQHSYPHKM